MKSIWIIALGLLGSLCTNAQNQDHEVVSGIVYGMYGDDTKEPLIGAAVFWKNANQGVFTDQDGRFELPIIDGQYIITTSYTGFLQQEMLWNHEYVMMITLKEPVSIAEVDVVAKQKSTEITLLDPIKVERIGEKELQKAACCNLAESFETTPSIDVSFTDGITAERQIRMLGLGGPYLQKTRELIPTMRGVESELGLALVPGTWVESIQLSKGVGSVAHGYESISGQMNMEWRKPNNTDKLFLNTYVNQGGRLELNAHSGIKVSPKVYTGIFAHGSVRQAKFDNNEDGFLDMPISKEVNVANRWTFDFKDNWRGQIGVGLANRDRQAGQKAAFDNEDHSTSYWKMDQQLTKATVWVKNGIVSPTKPYQSIGIMLAYDWLDDASTFGNNPINSTQSSGYANVLFQSILGSTDHSYKIGASLQLDHITQANYAWQEQVPGAFMEYTYKPSIKFSSVLGLRIDHSNLAGTFVTPRVHLRFAPSPRSALRASAGRGQRWGLPFSDYRGLWASSRTLTILGDSTSNTPYGLDPEVAWNMGGSYTYKFDIAQRESSFSVDYFYTTFENQVVMDAYSSTANEVFFYNLDGKSEAHAVQAQLDLEAFEGFDIRMAYRFYYLRTSYASSGDRQPPLIAPHRFFVNLAYETKNNWAFDWTTQWIGKQELPTQRINEFTYLKDKQSKAYFLSNAQISKSWQDEKWSIYLGAENIFNYRQDQPILNADAPFGQYFDASVVWAPIFGTNVYLGARFRI